MIDLSELVDYLTTLLSPEKFKDYCPNGLQVEGKSSINKIITGVTANLNLIDRAIKEQADVLLVHHGFFWPGENPTITGIKYKRLKKLLEFNISLIVYHLPLDCHKELGNNAQFARVMGWNNCQSHEIDGLPDLIWTQKLVEPLSIDHLKKDLHQHLNQKPLHLAGSNSPSKIEKIAWCSGAAQKYIETAYDLGAEVYISGEVSESTLHLATEWHKHYLACGHHATERFGIQALGNHLAKQFGLIHQFIDVPNPV